MIKIGVLGCGRIIKRHIEHLKERPAAEIGAICDVSEDALAAAKEAYFPERDIPTYKNPAVMYGAEKLDAVIIATPHTLHYQHAIQAMEAGCHVFLEKPMVTATDQAYKMAARAAELDKVVAIGFNTSSKKVFQYLRRQIRDKTFGALEMVSGYLSQNWMQATSGSWRQDPALSGGGQAYDSGAHIINSLLWSVESEPEMVFALTDHKNLPVDINSVTTIRFANGVLANLAISGNCATAGQHMVFIFENGKVEIDGWAGGWIRVQADDFPEEPEIDIPEVFPVNNFVDAVIGKSDVAAGIRSGINHSLLMEGIYESAQSGLPVNPKALDIGVKT
ncbi:MAG: Gfo/Idh/MocA family oxidoreductase [Spirochaetales bacterium]|jgi:predicted dehydrogenase|nr:Gfo/Idh/MocA family oxidoreductase [Spirochaetales bacterium]